MVLMSMAGSAIANRSTVAPLVTAGVPPRTRDASKLVPPMSMTMKLSSPCGAVTARLAAGAAAGPDSSVVAALAAAVSGAATPPFDCMIRRGPSKPDSTSRSCNRAT